MSVPKIDAQYEELKQKKLEEIKQQMLQEQKQSPNMIKTYQTAGMQEDAKSESTVQYKNDSNVKTTLRINTCDNQQVKPKMA